MIIKVICRTIFGVSTVAFAGFLLFTYNLVPFSLENYTASFKFLPKVITKKYYQSTGRIKLDVKVGRGVTVGMIDSLQRSEWSQPAPFLLLNQSYFHLATFDVALFSHITFNVSDSRVLDEGLVEWRLGKGPGTTVVISLLNNQSNYLTFRGILFHNNNSNSSYTLRSIPKLKTVIEYDENNVTIRGPADWNMMNLVMSASQLLSCNRTLAAKFAIANNATKPLIPHSKIKDLNYMQELFLEEGVVSMLFGGTLLGWYRECSFIPDTTDLDMAAQARFYTNQLERRLIKDTRLKLYWILGKPTDSLELSVYAGKIKIDMFFLFEESNSSWVGGMIVWKKAKLRWTYPVLDGGLCSGILLDYLFHVPCNVVEFLEADYGPEWYKPFHDSKFVWYKSHHNIKEAGVWSKREWSQVYRTKFG